MKGHGCATIDFCLGRGIAESRDRESSWSSQPLQTHGTGPDKELSECSGLSDDDFREFDDCWIDRPIFTRFELIAARAPEKVALVDDVFRLTYLEVQRAAQHLALRLEAVVPVGRPVGIFLPNGALFPIAALACLAAGRVYVPIDLNYPDERNDQIIREAGLAAVILDRGGGISCFPLAAIHHLDIRESLGNSDNPRILIAQLGGPAVVVYTSGSTGRPKGICNDQRAISQRVAQFTNTCRLNSNDRFILLSSPGTIAGIRDTFAALLNGATLYIADPHHVGIGGILRTFRDHRITICYMVPALLRELLRLPTATGACGDIRVLRLGGDTVLASDIALCRNSLPQSCRILIGFGSTEAPTIFQWFVPPNWNPDGPTVPCGYALPDISISLLAESGTQATCGEVAEVIVRSRYIALGTWQHGHLQPEAFQVDPDDSAARIIHTGDLVRLRADGLAELVGRKDRQLKIRGYRVDPSDIESVLRGCDDVADAVVTGRSVDGTDVLIAYVASCAADTASIHEHLHNITKSLPGHMRPARIHIVDAIPRLPSFKPDIKMLQNLEDSISTKATPLAQPWDAPATELETKTLAIWRQLLRADDLGVSDNFFDAGGNSLLAMTLALEIESQLGIEISLETIFDSPTVRKFCTSLSRGCERKPAVILPIRSGQPKKKALYFIHSGFEFSALSDALTGEISTAFVTTNGTKWLRQLIDGRDILAVVDRLSEAYAQTIFARHQTGPCYLAGHSFGGILAVETACKLEELGASPDIVFLFDTYLHSSLHRILYDILHNGWLFRKFQKVLQGNIQDTARRARFLSRNAFYRLTRSAVFKKSCTSSEEDLRLILRDLREEASQAYRGPTRALTSQTVLFRATKSDSGRTMKIDPNLGWARHLGSSLTVILTPGNHQSLLEDDHVSYVAGEINRRTELLQGNRVRGAADSIVAPEPNPGFDPFPSKTVSIL